MQKNYSLIQEAVSLWEVGAFVLAAQLHGMQHSSNTLYACMQVLRSKENTPEEQQKLVSQIMAKVRCLK